MVISNEAVIGTNPQTILSLNNIKKLLGGKRVSETPQQPASFKTMLATMTTEVCQSIIIRYNI
jgi:hypothetical protein